MPYYGRRKYATPRKPRTVTTRKKPIKRTMRATNNSIAQTVKTVLKRQVEKKHTPQNELQYNFDTINSSFSTPVNLSDCFNISQGTGDGERVGNLITCSKAVLNLIIRKQVNEVALPCEVHVFIGYLKGNRDQAPSATPFANFYQDGNTAVAWNGTMLRTLRKPNADLFVISNKFVVKIGSSTATTTQYNNNDFPILIRKRLSLKPLLGKVKYQYDNVSGSEHDKDLFMWASYVYQDDTIAPAAINCPVDLLYFVDMEYTDL